jgi:hypothetical protein
MMDKMRKKYQRKLNKKIREYNHAIETDELWQGRFVARQIGARWEKFLDNSDGILRVIIRMYDKKTGYYKDFYFDYATWFSYVDWHFSFDIIDHFIVKDLKVWQKEHPYTEIKNWNNVLVDKRVFEEKFNF